MTRQSTITVLKHVATLPEPFNVHDVEPGAPCASSANHFLKQWVERGWLRVVEPGGFYRDHHIVQRSYARTEHFPDPKQFVEPPKKTRPPRLIVTEFDKRYFEFRATLNLPDHSHDFDDELLVK